MMMMMIIIISLKILFNRRQFQVTIHAKLQLH
jgi:hypothetical protein